MSSASGVDCSPQLKSVFASSLKSPPAFLEISLRNDQLCVKSTGARFRLTTGWKPEWESMIKNLSSTDPSFFIFWKSKAQIVFISYVPESASVKDKMSYSASKGAINNLMTASGIQFSAVEQYFASSTSEMSISAYQKQSEIDNRDTMTEVEVEIKKLPKELQKNDLSKSAGFSLLAQISGKALPSQLKKYTDSGDSTAAKYGAPVFSPTGGTAKNVVNGSMKNFFSKPSEAKKANPFFSMPTSAQIAEQQAKEKKEKRDSGSSSSTSISTSTSTTTSTSSSKSNSSFPFSFFRTTVSSNSASISPSPSSPTRSLPTPPVNKNSPKNSSTNSGPTSGSSSSSSASPNTSTSIASFASSSSSVDSKGSLKSAGSAAASASSSGSGSSSGAPSFSPSSSPSKCVVDGCDNKRVKAMYCLLHSSINNFNSNRNEIQTPYSSRPLPSQPKPRNQNQIDSGSEEDDQYRGEQEEGEGEQRELDEQNMNGDGEGSRSSGSISGISGSLPKKKGVSGSSFSSDSNGSNRSSGKSCAQVGCERDRIGGKPYCAAHSNEARNIANPLHERYGSLGSEASEDSGYASY